ncbi:NrdC.10 [Vibrio phage nt-1]|uniref:NrdC.10 n=1 Tax=Vibrio phage nt-1 TaxID=115992 RepID=R9TGU3_9CAUD|nr:hypothetical protein VPFG_00330 [Vibrio phage nt-1]AGN30328.1 NrdC.10 [Vibrio phage nt-1]
MYAIIKNALNKDEIVNGTFEVVTKHRCDKAKAPKDGRIRVMINGEATTLRADRQDVSYTDTIDGAPMQVHRTPVAESVAASFEPEVKETEEEIAQRIDQAFEAMDIFSEGAIEGHVTSLIISGAAGVGKTFTLERDLKAAEAKGKIEFKKVAGKCTGLGLFTKLWECRHPGSVLLLDDVDVFKDEDQLNLLKAALDTGEERWVSWASSSSYFEEQGIDQEFLFEGTVIFISNKDFDRELQAGTKLAPHFQALISRSVYLDLGVHSKEEIMVRIKQVVRSTTMLQDLGLQEPLISEMLVWIEDNIAGLRELSLRTCLKIANMMLTSPTKWEMLAKMTMLSKKRK